MENPFLLHKNDPAPETETKAFWQRLRQFYRTGEINNKEQEAPMTSALLQVLGTPTSGFPYSPPGEGDVRIEAGNMMPFSMLSHLLTAHQKDHQKKFANQLSELIVSLNRIFKKTDKQSATSNLKKTFDFAEGLIAFDQLLDLVPEHSGEDLSEKRLGRLQGLVEKLEDGIAEYQGQVAIAIIDKKISKTIKKAKLFENTKPIDAVPDPFEQAQKLISAKMHSFAELIKTYRIAYLEAKGEYQPEIQDDYFQHFTWHRLLDEELTLFHPVVLIVEHQTVFDHLASFSRLLASNLPVNIVVLNDQLISMPNKEISWEDASHQFRQELAALAIAHRNVYTFQSTLDDPAELYQGLSASIKAPATTVIHLLNASEVLDETLDPSVRDCAAKAGRHFPSITYDPQQTNELGKRFNLNSNLQPEKEWPQFELKAKTTEESEEIIEVAFTYADYKATYPEKASELFRVSSAFYTDDLIPLSTYLSLDEKLLYGKIPFIWVVDEHQELHRAAVPNVWVVSCQERLDFWRFLQELGGVNNHYVNAALADKGEEISQLVEGERAKIEAIHQVEIEEVKKAAMDMATDRLAQVLLYLDEHGGNLEAFALDSAPTIKAAPPAAEKQITETSEEAEPSDHEPTGQAVEASTEPWIESTDCTSCNECTDQYPNLFAYNDEQQAIIKDATKGTYEQLVKAAEKCPAACIHPGLPLNKNESNLEALKKRAEKFN